MYITLISKVLNFRCAHNLILIYVYKIYLLFLIWPIYDVTAADLQLRDERRLLLNNMIFLTDIMMNT